ncbi:zinc finger MYND domain-containing protein 15 [Latimeria chalumnae]|uniref:zinc finger MYND domain-containing protein 15 n=1 Tax=Latimeria chalumnae TaxID=7897 RepID=UPI00313C141A
MEFVTGYQEPLIDFSELMFSWYHKYLSDRDSEKAALQDGEKTAGLRDRERRKEAAICRLPQDQSLWILHILKNSHIAISVENPERQIQDKFYNEEALSLRDLNKFITVINLEKEEETEEAEHERLLQIDHLLLVTDENGTVLGFDYMLIRSCNSAKRVVLALKAYSLLCQSMAFPLGAGEARRPSHLTVGDPLIHGFLEHMVSKLGVKMTKTPLRSWALTQNFTFPSMRVKACHVCKRRAFEAKLDPCEQCQAVLYCSERCRILDWKKRPEDVSHQYWCSKMEEYMKQCKTLADFPFTYTKEATSVTFDKESFLSSRELNCGYWVKESMLIHPPNQELEIHEYLGSENRWGFLKEGRNPYEPLKKEGQTLLCSGLAEALSVKAPLGTGLGYPRAIKSLSLSPSCSFSLPLSLFFCPSLPLSLPLSPSRSFSLPPSDSFSLPPSRSLSPLSVTWKEYYQRRGLDLDSPASLLLTYPLTIYYIITSLVPQHFPELNILTKQSLKIHIMEAHKEFDIIKVFWELSVLLPHVAFELHFVGDRLPKEADEEQFSMHRKDGCVTVASPNFAGEEKSDKKSIRVKGYSRPYYMVQGPKPDLVIGFNSGFGLSGMWLSSLPRLQSLRAPAYFTECSEYSCAIDDQIMGMATGGTISRPLVNPFRSPFRIIGIDNEMPWYSNAFVFHLVYKASPNSSKQQWQQAGGPERHAGPPEDAPESGRRKKDKKQNRNGQRKRK